MYNATGQLSSEAYRSPTLPNGQHILTVTNLDDSGHLLGLDFFQVFTPDDVMLSTSSSTTGAISTSVTSISSNVAHGGPTTSTTSPGTTASRPDTTSTPNPSSTTSSTTKPRDPSLIPIIVGPIFGAIVICGIILLLLKHRRRKLMEADSRNPLAWEDYTHAGKPLCQFSWHVIVWLTHFISFQPPSSNSILLGKWTKAVILQSTLERAASIRRPAFSGFTLTRFQ